MLLRSFLQKNWHLSATQMETFETDLHAYHQVFFIHKLDRLSNRWLVKIFFIIEFYLTPKVCS